MGVLDKFKEWFGDDYHEEDDEEIVTEKSQVKITAENVPEKKAITDTTALKEEEKATPVFFDDEDFKEIKNTEVVKAVRQKVEKKQIQKDKNFQPSPIISPVYGILDKNYAKEDISQKRFNKPAKTPENTDNIDIDWIRKKAYGTLDDDLEQELFKEKHVLVDEKFVQEKDLFEELDAKKEEETVNMKEKLLEDSFFYEKRKGEETPETDENEGIETKINEKGPQLEKREEACYNENSEDKTTNDEESKDKKEKMGDDLFNLIDSMHQEKEDE